MLTSLLAATLLASQAAAFLVPLEVAKAVKSVEDKLHLTLINQKAQSIALECPNCYFDTANDRQKDYAVQPQNELAMNFTINDKDNSLAMNGQRFYPLSSPLMLDLYAPLVRTANGIESPPIHLGFALEYLPFQSTPEGTIHPIQLTILDLDGVQVKVPSIKLNIIKLPSQELLIAGIDTIPFEESPGSKCTTSLCRVKEIAVARLREMLSGARARVHHAGKKLGMGGCRGKKQGSNLTPIAPHPNGRLPGHRRPHRNGQGNHEHHHRHHGLRRFIHKTIHLFIIPAILGITGGLTASAIGMLVGQFIVFVWFKFIRGGMRGNASRARREASTEEEKEVLVLDEEDLPPQYEDAPKYEEVEGRDTAVEETKH